MRGISLIDADFLIFKLPCVNRLIFDDNIGFLRNKNVSRTAMTSLKGPHVIFNKVVMANGVRTPKGIPAISPAANRWAGVGPYYAMMPTSFALQQIKRFTNQGDVVLDPFCGRGTVPFAAAALGRSFFGIEIFPVGWVYSAAKYKPASQARVEKRLEEIAKLKPSLLEDSEFFRMAYAPQTLRFLCAARQYLDWQDNHVDRTLMALILICLHDKEDAGLSNQMSAVAFLACRSLGIGRFFDILRKGLATEAQRSQGWARRLVVKIRSGRLRPNSTYYNPPPGGQAEVTSDEATQGC
jgi:hypothetical protein